LPLLCVQTPVHIDMVERKLDSTKTWLSRMWLA
jgi:hypothetical protein